MATVSTGVSRLQALEAILLNPETYRLAEEVPSPDREHGGRARDYPNFAYLFYEALISVYRSARQVEAELSYPAVWRLARRTVRRMFPNDREMRLPAKPMRRHHYLYVRNRYLTDPQVLKRIAALHREGSCQQARDLGLIDPSGSGSWTHPHLSRMLYADGKVITPLFKGRKGDTRVDKATGEVRHVRYDPDADLHFEGDGELAYGTKFVVVAVRSDQARGRIILDFEWVADKGSEAKVAMGCFEQLAPLVTGAQGVIYDTALRGIHHQVLLRKLGLIPVNKVTAKRKGSKKPRRAAGRRVEKSIHVEDKRVRLKGGTDKTVRLFARGGAIGIVELSDVGEPTFTELPRVRTHRNRDKSGRFRWYNDYVLPEESGGGVVTVRLHCTEEDAARGFNRTENVRVIPPSDPDFKSLYARRNDAESINRAIDDSMWLSRAHSVGHSRQHVNLIGYALMVNSLALLEQRQRAAPPAA
jgi:Uri superfamily endonuclease